MPKNAVAILEEAGVDVNHVVKTTVFLKDMNTFAAMNGVYAEFLQIISLRELLLKWRGCP